MTLPQLVQQLAGDAKIIFDVGAAEGCVAGEYLKLFPHATVYAFEPTPGFCKLKSGPRLKVIPAAVLDKSGITKFNINTKHRTNSVLDFTPQYTMHRTVNIIEVAAVSLDDFCRSYGIERIDILKVDVQGIELRVLKGATGLFSKGGIGVVIVELQHAPVYKGQCKRGEVGKFLSHHGFVLRGEFPALRKDKLIHSNGVFSK